MVLTSQKHRLAGQAIAVDYPMAGFPVAQLETNIRQLVQVQGRKVALYEQFPVSDHDNLITRRLTRIYTPGTLFEPAFTTSYENNFLLALKLLQDGSWALAYTDLSTGEAFESRVSPALLSAEVARIDPKEIVLEPDLAAENSPLRSLVDLSSTLLSTLRAPTSSDSSSPSDVLAAYLSEVILDENAQIGAVVAQSHDHMHLSPAALSALEIKQTKTGGVLTARGSLLSVIRRTSTPGGSRLLAQRLCMSAKPILLIMSAAEPCITVS